MLENVRVVNMADCIAGRVEDTALEALETLCKGLAGKPLEEINLSDNALGTKGVKACLAVLASLDSLRAIHFNNNGMAAETTEVIADIFLKNGPSQLHKFHFSNNMSGQGGGIHLGRLLSSSP